MKIILSIIVISVVFLGGCSHQSRLDVALDMAGENKNNLIKTLDHYRDDSLKYQAAVFLIENMPYHHGWHHNDTLHLNSYYHAHQGSNIPAEQIYDSIRNKYGEYDVNNKCLRKDIENLDAEFLIDHIDNIFDIWMNSSWRKDVSFQTFCHHILPYRIRDEDVKPWALQLHRKFYCLLDSLRQTPDSVDIRKAATVILKYFQNNRIYYTHAVPQGANVGVDNVDWRVGDCKEFADILTWALRSVGIPCGCDMMLVRGDNNVPHYWNYIIDNDGKSWYCSITYNQELKEPNTYWNPKCKVWRESFALNISLHNKLRAHTEIDEIPPYFRHPIITDVSKLYANPKLLTVSIPHQKLKRIPKKDENIYICLSVRDKWMPIGVADLDDENILISDIEGDVVLRLATYANQNLELISAPFFVDRISGKIKYYSSNTKKIVDVCLLHKFNLRTEPFGQRMIGGIFEGSCRKDFSYADTLHIITKYPDRLYNEILIAPMKEYRYLRYRSPRDGYCDISEISFYDKDGNLLKGVPIGTQNRGTYDADFTIEKGFDGNPYTSFHYENPDDGWIGLKLHEPTSIARIVFTPRNRKNFIQPGNIYELFYCKDQWISAGSIVADSDSLLYSVPEDALLYLKNHSEGNQERIFDITEDGQRWL